MSGKKSDEIDLHKHEADMERVYRLAAIGKTVLEAIDAFDESGRAISFPVHGPRRSKQHYYTVTIEKYHGGLP